MRTAVLTALAIAIFTWAACGAGADSTADVLALIGQAADQICGSVAQSGHTTKTEVKGDVDATLSFLVKKLADLGIKGAGQINSTDYQGVLQDQLAATLGDIRQCKLKVFDSLQQKLLSAAPNGASGALEERLRVAQQRTEMSTQQCRADVDAIRAHVGRRRLLLFLRHGARPGGRGHPRLFLRSAEGRTFVDDSRPTCRPDKRTRNRASDGILASTSRGLGVRAQTGVGATGHSSEGLLSAFGSADDRRSHPPPARASGRRPGQEGPLGQEIIAIYARACDVLAQLNTLMAKTLTTTAQ